MSARKGAASASGRKFRLITLVRTLWIVKAVMIGLAIAPVVTWTVLVAKPLELCRPRSAKHRRRSRRVRSLAEAS